MGQRAIGAVTDTGMPLPADRGPGLGDLPPPVMPPIVPASAVRGPNGAIVLDRRLGRTWTLMEILALVAVLLVGLAARAGAILTQTYVVFADETFQYLEQAHRLAFGAGVVPWEYHDGIRSWLLPGIAAGLMRVGAAFDDDPAIYLRLIRLACAALSLSVVYVAFCHGLRTGQSRVGGSRVGASRIGGARIGGLAAAILTSGFCAIWFDLIWFAPAVLTEVVAAHCALVGLFLADGRDRGDHRRLLMAGLCLGLAVCLRYQYGPALAAASLWQHRLDWVRWRWLVTGGLVVVLPLAGVLDWVTWGAPFQSIWLNFIRNTVDGVSSAMGTEPLSFFPAYLTTAFRPAPVFVFLAVLGATRAPALAIAALGVLAMHMVVPHKEVRFIYLALAILPVLIGLGAASVLQVAAERVRAGWVAWLAVPLLVLGGWASWSNATSQPLVERWDFNRGPVAAFLLANRQADLCGMGVRDMRVIDSGGYVYLHRDVPIYFSEFSSSVSLAGVRAPLRFSVERQGREVPQVERQAFAASHGLYNYLVAPNGWEQPGFVRLSCFDWVSYQGRSSTCLYRRPGTCDRVAADR